MNWVRNLLFNNFYPIEQEAEFLGDKEPEHAEIQLQKRRRKMDEQSIVIYGQEQGSSSNSQLTCPMDSPLSSNSNISGCQKTRELKYKLDCLFARQSDVCTELEHAEFQPGKRRRKEVDHWLTAVQGIKNDVRRMIKDGQGSSSNFNLSDSIECFMKEVDELIQRSKFPNGLVLLYQKSTRLPLLLDIKPAGTDFQRNAEKILGWSQNHEHCIIGVYGMGGVGKTTLLMHIHDQLLQDSNHSGHVYWVTVSQNCPVRKLQDDIAKLLKLESFQEDDERKRAAILHDRLAASGQTVLILDDMWEQISGSKVGIPLENSNCKIILSTRQDDVCRKMKCKDFVIKAETLNEGEAWDLFVEKLGHYDTLEEEAKNIAWEIAKECGGLPLAIATMARSMTEVVDINEWKIALNDLKSARGQADMEEEVIPILRYSYDRLNDKTVQECFLSCILYGEDEKIKRTTLIDLWIHEGLLDKIESRDAQEAKGHVILNKLESSCLLESVLNFYKEKCVKMHDLIRDMGIIITKEHPVFIAEASKQLKQVPKEEKWSKDLVKVSLIWNKIEEIPSGMAPMTPNLTVLMLNYNPLKKIPDPFFVHMRALTVLNLTHTNIERVPESVSDLENLKGLLLADCAELTYVPSVAKLTKLRTLDLCGSWELKEAPNGLERLKCLETVSYIPWDVSKVIGFNEVIQSWSSLVHYRFWIHDFTLCEPSDELEIFYELKNTVKLTGGRLGEDKSSWLVPNTLEVLVIEKCDMKGSCLGDVFQSLGEATGVKYVKVKNCRGLETISGSPGTQQGAPVLGGTSQPEVLELEQLPDLRSITKLGVPHSFSRLRILLISGCPKLKVVLPTMCTNHVYLPNLESVDVKECEEVQEIFELNESTLSNFLVLPKLKDLILWCLPKLKMVFPLAKQLHLPCLKFIMVAKCEELEEIFGSHKATLRSNPSFSLYLPELKELTLKGLPKVKVVLPLACQLQLPSLSKIEVRRCEKVEEIFETNKATSSLPIFSLPNLKELYLRILPKMKVIFPFTQQVNLPELDNIVVENCDEVEELFGSNKGTTLSYPILSLPNLKHLHMEKLRTLKVIFPFTQQLNLPKLEKIEVRKCKGVEEIFESNKAFPSNPILWLPNLNNSRLVDLPELSSVYRGLLLCTFLYDPTPYIDNCPKLKLWSFPGVLTSDEPCSTMKSKQETLLLTELDINQPASLPHCDGNNDDDDDANWGASLSLFPC